MDPVAELNGPADLAAFPGIIADAALCAAWVYTPIGGMIAVCDDDALHLLEFPRRARLALQMSRIGQVGLGRTRVTDHLQIELTAYFAGKRPTFATPLALQGTPFIQSVWAALQAMPYGTTQTYATLATSLGRPTAARAAGRANGANPIAILVPCHRLLGAQGALTGYAGGLWRKEWLVAHEAQ